MQLQRITQNLQLQEGVCLAKVFGQNLVTRQWCMIPHIQTFSWQNQDQNHLQHQ
jgi:hypothetical protein